MEVKLVVTSRRRQGEGRNRDRVLLGINYYV